MTEVPSCAEGNRGPPTDQIWEFQVGSTQATRRAINHRKAGTNSHAPQRGEGLPDQTSTVLHLLHMKCEKTVDEAAAEAMVDSAPKTKEVVRKAEV